MYALIFRILLIVTFGFIPIQALEIGTTQPVGQPGSSISSFSGTTELVSVASDGSQGNRESWYPTVSADGRFVAFNSYASNLVIGDNNEKPDIFIYDRETGETEIVSVASDGSLGNGGCNDASISTDGRYVAFGSVASNLVNGDTNNREDVFVHDRQTGTTQRVSVASNGNQANRGAYTPSISADGRYIAFESISSNLVTGDTNERTDVFVHDRQTGSTKRISVASDGSEGNNSSGNPSISANGRFVAFGSHASNLVGEDTNLTDDVFIHDRVTGSTKRLSVNSDGSQGDGPSGGAYISANGRYVVFKSGASNLVTGDANNFCDTDGDFEYDENCSDVFVHDRLTGRMQIASVANDGSQANNHPIWGPSISYDGRYVVFASEASNLVIGDDNMCENDPCPDIFVRDLQLGFTTRVSRASDGSQSNGWSSAPFISGDGKSVTFASFATNLVNGDSNDALDIFVHDQGGLPYGLVFYIPVTSHNPEE